PTNMRYARTLWNVILKEKHLNAEIQSRTPVFGILLFTSSNNNSSCSRSSGPNNGSENRGMMAGCSAAADDDIIFKLKTTTENYSSDYFNICNIDQHPNPCYTRETWNCYQDKENPQK
ncbi:hypothetical protein L9F63_018571, partial [Diploptera punctata]